MPSSKTISETPYDTLRERVANNLQSLHSLFMQREGISITEAIPALGERLGLGSATINRYIYGRATPHFMHIEDFAVKIGLHTGDFLLPEWEFDIRIANCDWTSTAPYDLYSVILENLSPLIERFQKIPDLARAMHIPPKSIHNIIDRVAFPYELAEDIERATGTTPSELCTPNHPVVTVYPGGAMGPYELADALAKTVSENLKQSKTAYMKKCGVKSGTFDQTLANYLGVNARNAYRAMCPTDRTKFSILLKLSEFFQTPLWAYFLPKDEFKADWIDRKPEFQAQHPFVALSENVKRLAREEGHQLTVKSGDFLKPSFAPNHIPYTYFARRAVRSENPTFLYLATIVKRFHIPPQDLLRPPEHL